MSYLPIVVSRVDYSMSKILDHTNTPKERQEPTIATATALNCMSSSGAYIKDIIDINQLPSAFRKRRVQAV